MMQSRARTAAAHVVASVFAMAALSCGGAHAPGAMAPTVAAEASRELALTTAESAQVELERAQGELELALGGPRFATPPVTQTASQPAPPPAPAAGATDSVAKERDDSKSAPAADSPASAGQGLSGGVSASSDPCASACRALASMARATDHLCGLAGEADSRCTGARERVTSASSRVLARCPACAAP